MVYTQNGDARAIISGQMPSGINYGLVLTDYTYNPNDAAGDANQTLKQYGVYVNGDFMDRKLKYDLFVGQLEIERTANVEEVAYTAEIDYITELSSSMAMNMHVKVYNAFSVSQAHNETTGTPLVDGFSARVEGLYKADTFYISAYVAYLEDDRTAIAATAASNSTGIVTHANPELLSYGIVISNSSIELSYAKVEDQNTHRFRTIKL